MEITSSFSLKAKSTQSGKGIGFEFDNGMAMQKWINGEVRFFSAKDANGKRSNLNEKKSIKSVEAMKEAVAKRFK